MIKNKVNEDDTLKKEVQPTQKNALNYTEEDFDDHDSGIHSSHQSIQTVAIDENDAGAQSDSSSLTDFTIQKTSSKYELSTFSSRPTSSSASVVTAAASQESTPVSTKPTKKKSSGKNITKLFRRVFGSSTTSSSAIPPSSSTLSTFDPKTNTAYRPLSPLVVTHGPVRLLVLRHGERLDRYYSSQWLRQAFDNDGNYCRFSPILPETLPLRQAIKDFDADPPLTYKGLKDAYHTGTVLREKNIHINYCYSSPSLRCIQTAAKMLEGLQLQNKMKIRIEPGLFECTGWYVNETTDTLQMPRFMTKKELIENKYKIDKSYKEQMSFSTLSRLEDELEFYERSHLVTSQILKIHENELIQQVQEGIGSASTSSHVLFIAHAPSLETTTRKLCGGQFRPETLGHVIRNVDFLTMTVIEKTDNNCSKWIFRRNSFYGTEALRQTNGPVDVKLTTINARIFDLNRDEKMTTIPIAKMVNDLFLQWLSQEDTRKNLFAGLQIVRTGGKLPEPNYSKNCHTTTNHGGNFSKSQHFDSPPVSPVPRSSTSPRSNERKWRRKCT
ncbi:unnamed protein product, partial [Didymodactylos carnosus]